MRKRNRAFAAIINNGKIVMVHVKKQDREFWTLPGGGVEEGESLEETAVREAREEVNLEIRIVRYLFDREYSAGTEYCYLAEVVGTFDLKLGYDPEFGVQEQTLDETQWIEIDRVCNDLHVAQVLKALSEEELIKYNIVLE